LLQNVTKFKHMQNLKEK